MKTEYPIGGMTVEAAANLTRFRFVTAVGAVPAAGAYCPGVVAEDVDSGKDAAVVTHGVVMAESGAAITAGDAVEVDNQGRVITLNTGEQVGRVKI